MPDWVPNPLLTLPPPPASIRHLSCTAVSCDPSASQCVFPSVCVRLRQDGEAVEDQREGQASGGLQPEGWGRTDQEPLHHHFLTGKRSHKNRRGWLNPPIATPTTISPASKCQTESGEELWVLTPLGWDPAVGQEVKNRRPDETIQASGSCQTFGDIKIIKNHHFYNIWSKKLIIII